MTARHACAQDGTHTGPIRKLFTPISKQIDADKRTIEFVVSNATMDRDGDVVEPSGWRLERYRQNPVILWAHDGRQPPVAKTLGIAVLDGNLVATAQFADRETYEFADTVFRLYEGGFLNAVSAGFMADAMEPLLDEDGRFTGFRFQSQELWEFSAVPIPSNPDALVNARSKGINVEPCLSWIEQALDEGDGPHELLSRTWTTTKGAVHPVVQQQLLARNAAALVAQGVLKQEATAQEELAGLRVLLTAADAEIARLVTLTGAPVQLAAQEEPAQEPAPVQEASGPPVGWALTVYDKFPLAEALALQEDHPDLLGDATMLHALAAGDETALAAREVWAARGVYGVSPEEVLQQVKHLVVGSAGLAVMRSTLSQLKCKALQPPAAPQPTVHVSTPVTDDVLATLVAQHVEAQIKAVRGRVRR
jgi:hypothetical protein